MVKCLVTGSRGFIGSHLTNYLQSRGCWVRGVDIKTDCYLPTKEDEFLKVDLRFFENAILAVDDVDWVFNLAADMGGIGYITELNAPIMRNNVKINTNMLDASYLENVERYFFSSSACVYPRELQTIPEVEGLKENDVIPAHPDSAYGWEKLFTEILCKGYEKDYGLPVRIGRFHNIYGPCLDEQTEVLTENGWKFFKDLSDIGEQVLTLNTETYEMEYQIPIVRQAYKYDGKMFSIQNKSYDMIVTPDHKLFYSDYKKQSFQLRTVPEVLSHGFGWMKANGTWIGLKNDNYVLPTTYMVDGRLNEKEKIIPMNTWLAFLGWHLSEGSTFKTKRNYIIDITQNEGLNKTAIIKLIEEMGFHPYPHTHGVRIHSKQLYEHLKPLGYSYTKFIPRKYLMLHNSQLIHLWNALMRGDGEIRADGRAKYSTVSRLLANDVQELALKLGFVAKIAVEKGSRINRIYRIYVSDIGEHQLKKSHISEIEYHGMVYDVTIPKYHVIMARRNGKVVWTGNCTTYKGGQEKAPAALCRKVAEAEDGDSIIVWGDGLQTRSYTYITDCLDAVYLLMQSNFSEPINIGTSDLISVDDLARLIMKIAGKNLSIEHDLNKPQGVRGRNASLELIKEILGWTPKVSLEEGMTSLYKWVESQIKRDKN